MELHRQTCQACNCRELQNILRRGEEHPLTVYLRCTRCGELVARYKVSGYYHHGKGFDSWLQRYQGIARESGRSLMDEYQRVQRSAVEEWADVQQQLRSQGKLDDPSD